MRSCFVLLPALAIGAASAQDMMVGGYNDAPVGANETALLTKALANDALYSPQVTTRACFTNITSLQQQAVAGMNYKFHVNACEVNSAALGQGKCPTTVLATCAPEAFVITVYEQVWTNTTQVTSIQAGGRSSNAAAGEDREFRDGSGSGGVSKSSKMPTAGVPSPSPTPTPTSAAAVAVASGAASALALLVGALV